MSDPRQTSADHEKIEIRRGIIPDPRPDKALPVKKDRKRPVFVSSRRRRIPPWLIAALVFAALMAGLFLVAPRISDSTLGFEVTPDPGETLPPGWEDYLYGEDVALVAVGTAPVYGQPDAATVRIGEALLNERVLMLDAGDRVFIHVRLDDGLTGYIKREHLTADTSSLSPENRVAKVVVRTPFKRVMSHARWGSLVVEAPMGTVLYADYRNGDLLRVRLPGQEPGWINTSGVMLLPPLSAIPQGEPLGQLLVATVMAFYDSPLIPGGATKRGISPQGAIHVAGLLHGLNLSRDPSLLAGQGEAVVLTRDDEGKPDLMAAQEGDVIFFHGAGDPRLIDSLAMRVADDQLLLVLSGKSTLRLLDIESKSADELKERIMTVRRFQKSP
jgi:hypothetical protein